MAFNRLSIYLFILILVSFSLPIHADNQTSMVSKVIGDGIFIIENGKWHQILIKGVNMGLALPGKYASQYPTKKTDYLRWFQLISEMNANAIRMYDIFPPAFYEALLEHNTDSDKKKLWLIQGVWPPDENWSLDEAYENAFIQKLSKAVDVIHGRIQDDYSADISKYVLAFIFGKEWEPDVVFKNDNNNSSNTEYSGDYFLVEKGTPTECFLAKLCDALMRYESETYGWQRPVSFINWPTLDPIYHPTEHEPEEDIPSYLAKHRWHNDTATINFSNIKPTRSNEAGFFASYHIYPWNPDFMNN